MTTKLNNGDAVTASIITNLLRPATKRINRISDFNVAAITTGQLRYSDNKFNSIEQNKAASMEFIANTSSVQAIPNALTGGLPDILYKIKKDLEYIDAMVV